MAKTLFELLAEAIKAHVPTYRDGRVFPHDGGFDGCNGKVVVFAPRASGMGHNIALLYVPCEGR